MTGAAQPGRRLTWREVRRAPIEVSMRAGVRCPSSAYIRGLVPPGSLAGFRTRRPSRGPWSSAADGRCVTTRSARRVRVGPPGLLTSAVTGSSWPGQLPGAGPWRHPGRGLGHAGSRRRRHEEIVDGDPGGDRLKLDPHPPDRPGLCYTSHLKAAACAAKPRTVSQAAGAAIVGHKAAARRAGPPLPLVLMSSAIGQLERSAAHCRENV
jgi:hypothetical protein